MNIENKKTTQQQQNPVSRYILHIVYISIIVYSNIAIIFTITSSLLETSTDITFNLEMSPDNKEQVANAPTCSEQHLNC